MTRSRLFTSNDARTIHNGMSNASVAKLVYWPRDLLPDDCPEARIITWGYDTVVTHGYSRATSKNNIFAHAKDLLFSLNRERSQDTPIIFVAHSLGGIIVKEVSGDVVSLKVTCQVVDLVNS